MPRLGATRHCAWGTARARLHALQGLRPRSHRLRHLGGAAAEEALGPIFWSLGLGGQEHERAVRGPSGGIGVVQQGRDVARAVGGTTRSRVHALRQGLVARGDHFGETLASFLSGSSGSDSRDATQPRTRFNCDSSPRRTMAPTVHVVGRGSTESSHLFYRPAPGVCPHRCFDGLVDARALSPPAGPAGQLGESRQRSKTSPRKSATS